jgi:hypothetical protein
MDRDAATLSPNAPVPEVDPADLRAGWKSFADLSKTIPPSPPGTFSAVNINLITRECSSGANVFAIGKRVMLVSAMSAMAVLQPWTHAGELDGKVFDTLARVPLPNGIAAANFDDIIARLNSR